jgi:hypothetical protein
MNFIKIYILALCFASFNLFSQNACNTADPFCANNSLLEQLSQQEQVERVLPLDLITDVYLQHQIQHGIIFKYHKMVLLQLVLVELVVEM